jgi:hypothetical protein
MHEASRVLHADVTALLMGVAWCYTRIHICSRERITHRCSTPFHYTASRKREPNMNRTWMPAHSAITPQFDDPTMALPRLLTTFDHLTACLDLLPLTPSLSRDRLAVQHGSLHVLKPVHARNTKKSQPPVLPKATQGPSHPLMLQETAR